MEINKKEAAFEVTVADTLVFKSKPPRPQSKITESGSGANWNGTEQRGAPVFGGVGELKFRSTCYYSGFALHSLRLDYSSQGESSVF